MKVRIITTAILLLIVIIVFGGFVISKQTLINDKDNIKDSKTTEESLVDFSTLGVGHDTDLSKNNDESNSDVVDEIIKENEYYQIIRSDSLIYCYFYNDDNEIIKVEGPMSKFPKVTIIENNLLRFTLQAGTGIEAQWGYYYDTDNMVFSEVFQGIFDESDGKVACVGINKVIVSDIFDKSEYYKEFSDFSHSFSEAAAPITNVEFSEDGRSVKVSYLTGINYEEVTEVFFL